MDSQPPILPGATIGILGSGQLGRMLTIAAHSLGYHVAIYSPEPASPAGQAADRETIGAYDDVDAIAAFAAGVSVITFEFENISAAAVAAAASRTTVRPRGEVLYITQHRLREKQFLRNEGIPTVQFASISDAGDLQSAAGIGFPAILKTAGFGYDGKGQRLVTTATELEPAWTALERPPAILEALAPFDRELSVVAARQQNGDFAAYPVFLNRHERHILDVTLCPAPIEAEIATAAQDIAARVFTALDIVGVSCVELFQTGNDLLVNEVAPRVHNSGHLSADWSQTGQFEQHIRAICGLPLGGTGLIPPAAAMANLLGNLWDDGEPNWHDLLAVAGARLHLYGKTEPRPGRKMGHVSASGETIAAAEQRVRAARDAAQGRPGWHR